MRLMIIGLSAIFLLIGCGRTQPKFRVVEVNQSVDANRSLDRNATIKPKRVAKAPKKNRKVPPLPTPEVEIDMDSLVDQATSEVVS